MAPASTGCILLDCELPPTTSASLVLCVDAGVVSAGRARVVPLPAALAVEVPDHVGSHLRARQHDEAVSAPGAV